ncbi:hypothetical protein OIU84_003893 [Salix udensis]|uniref:Uncharacterized protein n=1 Tax=Salix udensis TaxID=889485 RepID=A0AAD6K122_9ROSI|nr:hypothetical protein OIU84_003893 [Salix udensis]
MAVAVPLDDILPPHQPYLHYNRHNPTATSMNTRNCQQSLSLGYFSFKGVEHCPSVFSAEDESILPENTLDFLSSPVPMQLLDNNHSSCQMLSSSLYFHQGFNDSGAGTKRSVYTFFFAVSEFHLDLQVS